MARSVVENPFNTVSCAGNVTNTAVPLNWRFVLPDSDRLMFATDVLLLANVL